MQFQYLLPLCGLWHFAILLLYNATDLGIMPLTTTSHLCSLPVVRPYAQWSGIAGGYGFYSREVGSSCYSTLIVRDPGKGIPHIMADPELHTATGRLRYGSLLDVYDRWVDPKTSQAGVDKMARLIAHRVGQYLSQQYPTATVHSRLTVIHIPQLGHIRTNNQLLTKHHLLYETVIQPPSP